MNSICHRFKGLAHCQNAEALYQLVAPKRALSGICYPSVSQKVHSTNLFQSGLNLKISQSTKCNIFLKSILSDCKTILKC